MTEDNPGLFQNNITVSAIGTEECIDQDFVGQLDEEGQRALNKKLFNEIKTGIRKHEELIKSKRRVMRHMRIAASTLLILMVNVGLWKAINLKEQKYQTGANETLQIELPDGSRALLNSNSSLTYSYSWTYGFDRKVELNGEAYFDIAKDIEGKRFVINEGEAMEVEVFGTEFNFKNQHPVHKLTLIEGSVKLGYQSSEGNINRMVSPGETIKLNAENHQLEAKTVAEPARLLAWQDRKLRMQNESLEDILSIVTELYDIELNNQKIPPTYQLISGSLPLTDNPKEVIENIEVL